MSMTAQDSKYHRLYEDMSEDDIRAIDSAYSAAREDLRRCLPEFKPNNCDAAEALVAAIARYVHESRVAAELA